MRSGGDTGDVSEDAVEQEDEEDEDEADDDDDEEEEAEDEEASHLPNCKRKCGRSLAARAIMTPSRPRDWWV